MPTQSTVRGQHLGAHALREDRPPGALVDETVGGDGHDDHVGLVARRQDVPDVAEMHQIEHAVAERDSQALRLRGARNLAELFDRLDLVVRCRMDGRLVFRSITHVNYPKRR